MSQNKIKKKFVCIWLDNQSNPSKDFLDTQNHLQTLINSFRYYDNLNRCLDFIINIKNLKIIFITLDIIAEKIISLIHSSEQIHSIYIFTYNKSIQQNWAKNYNKIQGFFSTRKSICQKIIENITQSDGNSVEISFISSVDINSRDVNRQDPSFMYFQLLKEIILNDHQDEKEEETKKDMLNYCRQIYGKSPETLNILDEFEQNFFPELSIYWYTRECFLYKILNTALWTPQPDVLYKLRYFIRHLHQQISSQAALQHKDRSSMIIVYRGQNMSVDRFEKLKQNIGGFVSFNNFLSTSLKRHVALKFIWGLEIGVLFEIQIDEAIEKFPFANIEHLSFHQGEKSEHELLFSTGTVFRIIQITKQTDFYHVQLILSNEIDEQLAEYTKRTREQIHSTHSFLSLLKLMHELSQYNSIDRFVEMLDDDISLTKNSILLGSIQHAFGLIYLSRGQSKEALDSFRQSLSLYLTILPADHPKLSPTYNNIGSVHLAQSDYDTALTFHQLALDCQSNSEKPNISSVITYTNNIASIYSHLKNYNEALVYHKRALELQKKHCGENDLSLTNTYNAISTIYYKLNDYEQATSYQEKAMALQNNSSESDPEASANCSIRAGGVCFSQGQYKEALEYFNRALEIQQKYFLPNNPSLAETYNYIGDVYCRQNEFKQSLSYHLKGLEIEEKSLSNNHPKIATSYLRISKDYTGLLCWSDALEYGFKAIEKIKKSSPADVHIYINHIGNIYYQKEEYENALRYYKETLELTHTYLSENDSSLIRLYYRIGETYFKLKQYNEALEFYQKTLKLELKSLPDNAKTIATTYADISASYLYLGKFEDAIIAGNQALDQLLKTLPKNHPEVIQLRASLDAIHIKLILKINKK